MKLFTRLALAGVATATIVAGLSACGGLPVDTSPAQLSSPTTTVAPAPAEPAATVAPPTYTPPDASSITLAVVVLSKQCFGSAGCDVAYRIQPTCTACDAADPSTYTVVYQLTGGSDGVQIGNLTITGSEAHEDAQDMAQTASSKATLTATVTEVLDGG